MRIVRGIDEQGSILLVMVLFLLVFAGLIIVHFDQLTKQWQKQIFYEKQYYYHYNIASSALLWGLHERWPTPTRSWFCKKKSSENMIACLKRSRQEGVALVKGASDMLSLYLLVEYDPAAGRLIYRSGYWFDCCLEKYECE